MELIKNKTFGGERPLFGAHDARLEDITITDGESGIKCCKNIECHNSKFYGKYPWWHGGRHPGHGGSEHLVPGGPGAAGDVNFEPGT